MLFDDGLAPKAPLGTDAYRDISSRTFARCSFDLPRTTAWLSDVVALGRTPRRPPSRRLSLSVAESRLVSRCLVRSRAV